jgi:ABC-2 type transport system permease protein
VNGAAGWIRIVMLANPLTYGVQGLRAVLFPLTVQSDDFALSTQIGVLALFCLLMFAASYIIVNRRGTKPAA